MIKNLLAVSAIALGLGLGGVPMASAMECNCSKECAEKCKKADGSCDCKEKCDCAHENCADGKCANKDKKAKKK